MMLCSYAERLQQTVDFLKHRFAAGPDIGIILGSGLSNFLREVGEEWSVSYGDIPHFPEATVEGHPGRLVCGTVEGRRVAVFAGRFHGYEGYRPEDVVYPVRVLRRWGASMLLISNAAGGVNPSFRVGDLMMIQDHIALSVPNPLIGPNDARLGKRFPDMTAPYSRRINRLIGDIAAELGITVHEGVYYGVTGPSFETRAEYRMIRALGGDAVGMSTVQEVIAAVHAGLEVAALSVIADLGIRDEETPITHEDVLREAAKAEPAVASIFRRLIGKL